MPGDFITHKKNEFFISIVKEKIHSFVMLGMMLDGKPKLLAKVGKSNLIDKSFGLNASNVAALVKKSIFAQTKASLVDEGISNTENTDISYQAYSISYEQYKEFLALTKNVHEQQLEHYAERINAHPGDEYTSLPFPEKGVRKLLEGIECYVPVQETGDNITFSYKNLDDYDAPCPETLTPARKKIIEGADNLHISNTCRTTAKAILNYTLGYNPPVPALFAVGLNYKTKLENGLPAANTFYILPPPPNCFEVSPAQKQTLDALYKRLENIPKIDPASPGTRNKYDALKNLYQEIAGQPQLSLSELLDKITLHRVTHNTLFDKRRSQSIVSRFAEVIGIKTETQRAYDRMEKAVLKEIKRLNPKKFIKPESEDGDKLPPTPEL